MSLEENVPGYRLAHPLERRSGLADSRLSHDQYEAAGRDSLQHSPKRSLCTKRGSRSAPADGSRRIAAGWTPSAIGSARSRTRQRFTRPLVPESGSHRRPGAAAIHVGSPAPQAGTADGPPPDTPISTTHGRSDRQNITPPDDATTPRISIHVHGGRRRREGKRHQVSPELRSTTENPDIGDLSTPLLPGCSHPGPETYALRERQSVAPGFPDVPRFHRLRRSDGMVTSLYSMIVDAKRPHPAGGRASGRPRVPCPGRCRQGNGWGLSFE